MTYHWEAAGMTAPLVLPFTVADSCLKLAGAEELRVLLWLSRRQMVWDAEACAAALGMPREECEQCLGFWLERGVIHPAEEAASPAAVAAAAAATSAPVARPAAVKPRVQEVLSYQKAHPHFADFLQHVSAMLGKAIGHGDTATLLYLIDTVGLPENVIIQEVAYAVSMGKPNMRYIEKLALDWADQDLTTFEAVDAHIHKLERWHAAAARVEKLLGLPRALTLPQSEMADRWLGQWQFSEEMLQKAAAICTENTGKFSAEYTNRILERWHAEGVDTPDKITADVPAKRKKKSAAATNPEESGLDTDSFDEQLLRYRPKFGDNP